MAYSLLDSPVQFLKGVGPRRAEPLQRKGILTARDLLYHLPRRYDDASTVHPIGSLQVGSDATVVGRVRNLGVIPTRAGLRIFQAVLEDDSGRITAAWPGQPWLERKIRKGDVLLAMGPVKHFHGRQLQPREFTVLAGGDAGDDPGTDGGEGADAGAEGGPGGPLGVRGAEGAIFVTYPATEGLPQWTLRRIVDENLDRLLEAVDGEEYLDADELRALGLPSLKEALRALHRPRSLEEAETGRRRVAFDELFFLQLLHALVRERDTGEEGIPFRRTNELIRPLHAALPFQLTGAQTRVLREILGDMASSRRMNRFLQGDVGSGKTLVALFAMLLAVESGYQAALMAPTEVLAEQHCLALRGFLEKLGEDAPGVGLLTGNLPAQVRTGTLEGLQDGRLGMVVGTHALIQEGVTFHRLGLAIVDEQHRFGVRQRMALGEREPRPDVLVMSATPIPRSLALTLYGDLDLSVLDELPPGRRPIRTELAAPRHEDRVHAMVERELAAGRQAYIVYPLVEASEKADLKAALDEHQRLAEAVFPERRLGLLHGRLPPEEKESVMRQFRDGELDILVTTTVVEVGIDVPNATAVVIQHAERFGLSQLHQLRGRVGRGEADSVCVLVADPGDEAAERLETFRRTNDGFEVARADLQFRGQGDLLGDLQAGRDPGLRHADLMEDEDLMVEAQRQARTVVEADPDLEEEGHTRIRTVLEKRHAERMKLFEVG